MESNEEILAPLRAKYGEEGIAVWPVPGWGLVVAAVPENEKEYDRLVNDMNDPNADKMVALRAFALACIVYPDRETAKKMFKAKPAFATAVAKRGQQLCGSEIRELGKD